MMLKIEMMMFLLLLTMMMMMILSSLDFISDNAITLHHIGPQSLVRGVATASVSEEIVVDALKPILDPSARPLLVCCNLGRHHTGSPHHSICLP